MSNFEPRKVELNTGEIVEISPINMNDWDAFEKQNRQFASETTHTYQTLELPLNKEKLMSKWNPPKKGDSDFIFKVMDSKGDMLSCFGVHFAMKHHPWVKHVAIFGMGILKSHWGTGLAVQIMKTMEDVARDEGATRLEALVRVANDRGVAFYKKMGFEIEGTRRKAALINGEYQDEYFIAKML